MAGYLTKEERRKYEQSRRGQVISQARDHRLLIGWLTKVQPDSLAKFYAFKARLQSLYPKRKDLSKSQAFAQFMYEEEEEENVVKVQPKRMTIPLVDIFQPNTSKPKQEQRSLEPDQSQRSSLSDERNLFSLSNDEVGELIKGLEGIEQSQRSSSSDERNLFSLSNDEVDELIKGLEGIEQSQQSLSSDERNLFSLSNDEVDELLKMDVDDFLV